METSTSTVRATCDPVMGANCNGCGKATSGQFFETHQTPADCGSIPHSQQEARQANPGPITLAFCNHCGLIQNTSFDAGLVQFQPGYEVALIHSPKFLEFQNQLADRLIHDCDLRGKKIVEIGCGAGDFLKLLCQRGGNSGIGIDPTVPQVGNQQLDSGDVTFIRDFFGEQYTDLDCDFICSLSMFEDVLKPAHFLHHVKTLASRQNTPCYFEVFHGDRALRNGEVWSIHYEMCNYFSQTSLNNMFLQAGFEVTRSGSCYSGDQYVFVESIPSNQSQTLLAPASATATMAEQFASQFEQKRLYWEKELQTAKQTGQRVVLWGSGGKGITFLNSIANQQVIECVVDINPDRQNRFIPGTGHPILPPKNLIDSPPDLVIITNEIYRDEIKQSLDSLGIDAKIAVA